MLFTLMVGKIATIAGAIARKTDEKTDGRQTEDRWKTAGKTAGKQWHFLKLLCML